MDTFDDNRAAAIRRLKDKRDFRSHLLIYLLVNAMLVIIWAFSGAGYFWPIWPMAGWGLGVAFHAWGTFGERPITEAEIRNELERGSRRSG